MAAQGGCSGSPQSSRAPQQPPRSPWFSLVPWAAEGKEAWRRHSPWPGLNMVQQEETGFPREESRKLRNPLQTSHPQSALLMKITMGQGTVQGQEQSTPLQAGPVLSPMLQVTSLAAVTNVLAKSRVFHPLPNHSLVHSTNINLLILYYMLSTGLGAGGY